MTGWLALLDAPASSDAKPARSNGAVLASARDQIKPLLVADTDDTGLPTPLSDSITTLRAQIASAIPRDCSVALAAIIWNN